MTGMTSGQWVWLLIAVFLFLASVAGAALFVWMILTVDLDYFYKEEPDVNRDEDAERRG